MIPVIPAPHVQVLPAKLPEPAPVLISSIPTMAAPKPTVFTEVKTVSPQQLAPTPAVRASGFESPEASAPGTARRTLSAIGMFDSSSAADGGLAHRSASTSTPAGFSEASAGPVPSAPPRAAIRNAAFGEAQIGRSAAAQSRTPAAASATQVEILSKPRPVYTAEARALRIDGEVLLEVQFSASGEARVLRVVRGLGHGLDESAQAAAAAIRFRPARRDGVAVDSSAIVHIVFQLAN
jgi:TonB family protein